VGAGERDGNARGAVPDRLTELLGDPADESRSDVEEALERVERRRRQLFVVGGIAALGAAIIAALVLVVGSIELPAWVGWMLLLATALFLVEAATTERTLATVTRAVVEELRRTAQLEASLDDLAQLNTLARRVNAVLLPEEVYDVVLGAAVELLDATSGSIRLRVGELLAVAASSGEGAPPLGASVVVEEDPAVLVVTLGVDLVEEDPPRLALPVTVGGRHVGVLEVQRGAGAEPFTTRSALLARLFAEEAATAVVNANSYDLERRRGDTLVTDRQQRADAVADTVHDLRAPLASLVAYTELLRDRFDDLSPDQRRESVDALWVSSSQLTDLIDAVFESAAAEAQATRQPESVKVAPIVRSVAAAAQAASSREGAQVHVLVPGAPVALADADSLQRVLTNLVGNALEHGSAEVRVRVDERRNEVRIHVADRGPGIPPPQLETVFDRRPSAAGSPRGRGLSIVDSLVRAMGGSVSVRSQMGVGTAFTVRLPTPATAGTED
jgi:signal transduction histidine kinase